MQKKLNVVILGTGKLATDLLVKVTKSTFLHCVAFVGRRHGSPGIAYAKGLGIHTSTDGIHYLKEIQDEFELVFDVTNAKSHLVHAPILLQMKKKVIDLTPSHLGAMVVPSVNIDKVIEEENVSMISCGGQSSLPILNVFSTVCKQIDAIEIVSSISSNSAGSGTRVNIDEYIEKTEHAIQDFTQCKQVKAMLILNPAEPPISMKTTLYVKTTFEDLELLNKKILEMIQHVQGYVPGYRMSVAPSKSEGVINLSLEIRGAGDHLPNYSGNLDIINSAAIQVAEFFANECHNQRILSLCSN